MSDTTILIADPFAPAGAAATGAFAGLPAATVAGYLTQAQAALVAMMTTGQPTTVTYGSGDGQKSVTYSRNNEAQLRAFIGELQKALGLNTGRRPMRPMF